MANKRTAFILAALFPLMFFLGCTAPKGVVYTHVVRPVALPYGSNRKVAERSCRVPYTKIKEPITIFNLSVLTGMDEVRWEMEKKGIRQVRYADLETYSIFFGCFERYYLILYGDDYVDPLKKDQSKEETEQYFSR